MTLGKGKGRHSKVCGKIFGESDVGVWCEDCAVERNCLICMWCFEKGDHKGHRFFIKQKVSGMCDCGDPESWRKEGNCENHE